MDTFGQLDSTDGCSTFFPDEMFDLFGDSDWALDAQLPELSFPELEFAGLSDHFEDTPWDLLESSDSNGIPPWHLGLLSTGAPLEAENSTSTSSQTSSKTVVEENSDCDNADITKPLQPQMQDQDDKDESQKRKWRDSIVVFPANPDVNLVQKRRRAFGPARREEVALNRMIGACTQCKTRKGRV
jgi:hypothetical protein